MKKRKRRRKVRKEIKWIGFVFLLILVTIGIASFLIRSDITEYSRFPESIQGIPVYTDLIDEGSISRPSVKRKIKYIVIHETDNYGKTADAEHHNIYLKTNGKDKNSWHYTVDEGSIYHHLPDNEVGWHAGDGLEKSGGNLNGIGIELCVNKGNDFDKTMDNAAWLTAYLLKEYNLKIDAVKQHNDFSGKDCPKQIRENDYMEQFLTLVKSYMKELK